MNSFVTKPFIKLNNWAKHLKGRKVHTKDLAFSSRIRQHLEDKNWIHGTRENRASIFGQGTSPFDEILQQHGAKEGDIVLLDAHSGEPPVHYPGSIQI